MRQILCDKCGKECLRKISILASDEPYASLETMRYSIDLCPECWADFFFNLPVYQKNQLVLKEEHDKKHGH